MPRCPDCNRFVALNTEVDPEVELQAELTEEEGENGEKGDITVNLTGTVRIVNECADCGTELTEFTFDVDASETVSRPEGLNEVPDEGELSGEEDITRTEDYVTTDRKGKPITNPRYQKKLYGFSGQVEVSIGDHHLCTFDLSDNTEASSMEALY